MKHIASLLVLVATTMTTTTGAQTPAGDFDLLITNGRLINGIGNPWFVADVGIRGDAIAEIGDLAGRTATRTIDAERLVIAPGFIDMHTHVDYAFDSTEANAVLNFLMQGVTTVRTGSDGSGSFRVAETKARWEAPGCSLIPSRRDQRDGPAVDQAGFLLNTLRWSPRAPLPEVVNRTWFVPSMFMT